MILETRLFGLLAALAAILLAVAACGHLAGGGVWVSRDLWIHPPESAGGEILGVADTLHQRGLRAIVLAPGRAVRWRLLLGERPVLRFRPIAAGECGLALEVEKDGGGRQVYHAWPRPPEPSFVPPPFADIDLGVFAGQEIELVATAGERTPGSCQRIEMASPVLVEKKAPERPRPGLRTRLARALGRQPAPPPNVVLISADTLRADALGFWGRSPSLTPALDRLAATGDTFTQAYSTINSTNPSFVSLMTGLYAKDHHVYDLVSPLPDSHETLIEKFERAGYITRAVLAATHLGSNSGLAQGVHGLTQPYGQFYGETVSNLALHYLQEPVAMPEPFFLWLHYFDAHVPHNPPAPWARGLLPEGRDGLAPPSFWRPFREVGLLPFDRQPPRFLDGSAQLYASEVAYLDRQIERVLRALEDQELLERTLLIFVADHGETLGERGNYFDHVGLFGNTTHVPLVVLRPGQREGRVFPGLVQSFDLFPTLLHLAGREAPEDIDARDLYQIGPGGRPAVFAEHANATGAMVRTSRSLLYRNTSEKLFPLGDYFFDLEKDPGEERNLAGQGLAEEERLRTMLGGFLATRRELPPATPHDVSPEEHERLRALGYVH